MRLRLLTAALLVLCAAGCAYIGVPATAPAGQDPPTGTPLSTSDRRVGVYAAMLRQYLTSSDHSFGEGHRFPGVYVLDSARPDAADPMTSMTIGAEPIPKQVQAGINELLGDVGPVTFIAHLDEVIVKRDTCAMVRDRGILITLGTVPATGERLEVGVTGFVA